jgi:hypothetical protein
MNVVLHDLPLPYMWPKYHIVHNVKMQPGILFINGHWTILINSVVVGLAIHHHPSRFTILYLFVQRYNGMGQLVELQCVLTLGLATNAVPKNMSGAAITPQPHLLHNVD